MIHVHLFVHIFVYTLDEECWQRPMSPLGLGPEQPVTSETPRIEAQ